MKELVFLPDRDGWDELSDQTGFVRLGAENGDLAALAQRLTAPVRATASVNEMTWRGVLALALLCDVWAGCDAELSILSIRPETSEFASLVLSARPAREQEQPVELLLLRRGEARALMGVVDREAGLRLPAAPLKWKDTVPERAAWIDRESGAVADPTPYLTGRDRTILLDRMACLGLNAPQAEAFAQALREADAPETQAVAEGDEQALERLAIRMEAVHGLKDFEAFGERSYPYRAGGNPLMTSLTGEDGALETAGEPMYTYLWNGVPFACSSSLTGLTTPGDSREAEALTAIMAELATMSGASVGWNNRTAASLQSWLDEQRNGELLPQARERVAESVRVMRDNGRQVQSTVTLTWPWNETSGAVKVLLAELLGEEWLQAAAAPFADRLTKLTGHILGDTVLQACCACADGVLLPPLSKAMAACVAGAEEGAGLAVDALRFQPCEDGGITASFLLRGQGEVLLTRHYTVDEIVVLDEAEAPCAAVWPCLPMEKWRAYHVFVRGGVEVAALDGGAWKSVATAAGVDQWRCLHTTAFPACLTLLRDGLCLGALPNLLPLFRCEQTTDVVAAIDLGSSQTAVAFAINGEAQLLEGQELTRMLVMPQDMEADEFLLGLTPASVIPTAVAVTGRGDTLFTDGHICRVERVEKLAALDAHALRTTLKWRSDAESVRARGLLMHQVMLGASLTAMLSGARSITWRVSIADEMGEDGREAMIGVAIGMAVVVAQETGLSLTAGQNAVTWAEESAALNTCLRAEGSGRGSYCAVDLGGGSTKLRLWVQGQNTPVAGAVLMDGVQTTLLSALYAQPQRLLEDFADCGDERLLQAVVAINAQLNEGQADARHRDKAGLMLDSLMDTLRSSVVQHLNVRFAAQNPTYMQSVLLETEAAILFIAGLMLAQAGDNVMLNHRLPEDLTVCLSGRGAWLLDTLTPAMRNSLQHLMHVPMRLDHPVRFVTLRPASMPAQSVALGLAVTRDVQRVADTPMVRTRESFAELMLRLMQQLCAAFPMHMWRLHEGLFDYQGGLTAAGVDTIRRVAARCYGDGEDIPAAVMDFVRILRAEAILPDHMTTVELN